jgi:2,5-furandicarboxylate decarboxylase 1
VHSIVPDVTAVHFSNGSVPYHLVVQIDKKHEGIQRNVIMAAFVAHPFIKTVTLVDTDVDIFSVDDVEWAVQTRCQFEKDVIFMDGIGHRLNPSVDDDKWTRMGIDATVPLPREEKFVRATVKQVNLEDYDIEGG